jgi:N-acetyl sugar amidotransferase
MKACKKCVMLETRPRLTFNQDGVCAACEWGEEKKTSIDWKKRKNEFVELCNSIRGKYKFDCLVPVSGGKDSTYVAHKMKYEYNLNVLTVTVTPPLETELIQNNLKNFLSYGYDNMKITPNPVITKFINKKGFIEQGRPLLSWTTCLNSVMLQIATSMNIPLIMFGEEGESEYGGSTKLRYTPYYTVDDAIDIYTYGNNPLQYLENFSEGELKWWMYPTEEELKKHPIKVAHWSYFENWDSYRHYIFARDNYAMKSKEDRSSGTYTNFGQLDTPLYDLHTYMMYLKFGFGRCLQDVCIDIRGGRLSREDGIEMVRKYDGEFIEKLIPVYCEYYGMTREEFDSVLDKHANKDLFKKVDGIWKPTFEIK